jgi:hypothetical protein
MAKRITAWRYKPPDNPDDLKLYRRLMRASKGSDLGQLKDHFSRGFESGAMTDIPYDAQLAFVTWVDATSARRWPRVAT